MTVRDSTSAIAPTAEQADTRTNGPDAKAPRMAADVVPALDVLEHLALRFSVGPKYLCEPAPSQDELLRAARVALRAPDHGGLGPFRFVRVAAHQRERLGELFALDARRRGRDAVEVEQARRRAYNGPALIGLIVHLSRDAQPEVSVQEQLLSAGAGLMNFLNALHLMGFGAKVLSGASIRDPDLQRAFCGDGEVLLAWIVTGTPTRAAHAKHADEVHRVLSDWAD